MIIEAYKLRNKEVLKTIDKTKPGWYLWLADDDSLKELLNSKYINKNYYDDIRPYLTTKMINNKPYYYIYVGIAVRESVNERLNWHVNQRHLKSSVESGYLSTLRQSLSSLVANDQYNEEDTNKFIDTLLIEYYQIDLPIKSEEAKKVIEEIEHQELIKKALPINLKDNKNPHVKEFLKELSTLRKSSKKIVK